MALLGKGTSLRINKGVPSADGYSGEERIENGIVSSRLIVSQLDFLPSPNSLRQNSRLRSSSAS